MRGQVGEDHEGDEKEEGGDDAGGDDGGLDHFGVKGWVLRWEWVVKG